MITGEPEVDIDEVTIEIRGEHGHLYIHDEKSEKRQKNDDLKIPPSLSRRAVEKALVVASPDQVPGQGLPSLGSTFFNAVFSGELGVALWQRIAEADRLDRGLRLRILTNLEIAQSLPWELLFDSSRGSFMALSGRITLVRTRPDGYARDKHLAPLSKLNILVAEADMTGASLITEKDCEELERAMPGLAKIKFLSKVTLEALQQELKKGKFDVFHFAGSGVPEVTKRDRIDQTLRLIGSTASGTTSSGALLERQFLGGMLRDAGVRLAVLNASHSDWFARSLARYVPAAIGWREAPQVESHRQLWHSLYPLLQRMPLDLAVTATRQAMSSSGEAGLADWGKLIFFLQPKDGTFFEPAVPTRPAVIPVAPHENGEHAKLARLRAIYETNLDALKNRADAASVELKTELQAKIKKLTDQLGEG